MYLPFEVIPFRVPSWPSPSNARRADARGRRRHGLGGGREQSMAAAAAAAAAAAVDVMFCQLTALTCCFVRGGKRLRVFPVSSELHSRVDPRIFLHTLFKARCTVEIGRPSSCCIIVVLNQSVFRPVRRESYADGVFLLSRVHHLAIEHYCA